MSSRPILATSSNPGSTVSTNAMRFIVNMMAGSLVAVLMVGVLPAASADAATRSITTSRTIQGIERTVVPVPFVTGNTITVKASKASCSGGAKRLTLRLYVNKGGKWVESNDRHGDSAVRPTCAALLRGEVYWVVSEATRAKSHRVGVSITEARGKFVGKLVTRKGDNI